MKMRMVSFSFVHENSEHDWVSVNELWYYYEIYGKRLNQTGPQELS